MANFYFQSFGEEYRTLLEMFNLTAEEVQGIHNGIIYSVTDEKGNKVGRPSNRRYSVNMQATRPCKSILKPQSLLSKRKISGNSFARLLPKPCGKQKV